METRNFLITYKKINKYVEEPERQQKVLLSRANGDLSRDAKLALNIFMKNEGNLKKNEIISIQELDKNDNPIGEPITPTEDSAIIPIA